MILYATKQTIDRFRIKMPNEMHPIPEAASNQIIKDQHGDALLEWGLKLFYFDRRKCIQAMNFASKLTIFLIDVKVDDIENAANSIALYLLDMFKTDKNMVLTLEKFFSQYSLCAYSKLTDRSIISSLNRNQWVFANDGYAFYDYFENGILQTRKINHDVNFKWLVTQTIDGKTEYIYPGERFKALLLERYGRS
ncbi:MAG: Uncharacterized protein FD133_658 [Erysipelotrichaceae bacterium]|nr:MAG: hypothetical protein FD179_1328 [Erysipelotrichaceae bacterium]TXT18811.1 MAG: Uncharacterized protein FD133_658 [Erysipelotrichaceae bacterium]